MNEIAGEFYDALTSLDDAGIEAAFQKAVGKAGAIKAVEELMVPALASLGDEWISGKVALSQIYMGSRICEKLVERALPPFSGNRNSHPRMAIAVLSDFHTLGKRIVLAILRASGFAVLDYGRVDTNELVERVIGDDVGILLISVLMLPSALKVKAVRSALATRGNIVKIAVGGAPFRFDPKLWNEVGADAMGATASDAVAIVRSWCEERP